MKFNIKHKLIVDLLVVTSCKCYIKPITNPNSLYSHIKIVTIRTENIFVVPNSSGRDKKCLLHFLPRKLGSLCW